MLRTLLSSILLVYMPCNWNVSECLENVILLCFILIFIFIDSLFRLGRDYVSFPDYNIIWRCFNWADLLNLPALFNHDFTHLSKDTNT